VANIPTDPAIDPCEKCGAAVHGYVAEYCCNGQECGCMGRPLEPCWCQKCWNEYDADAKRRAAEFSMQHPDVSDNSTEKTT
jgi:hypothetical protein